MLYASVQQLIRDASIMAQKSAPEEDLAIQGGDPGSSDAIELNTGLRLLNQAIITNNIRGNNLSLLSNEQFILNQGTDKLELTGWAKILNVRYLLGNVWLPVRLNNLNKFLNQQVLNNTSGVPITAYLQRNATGIILNYFFPLNSSYTFDIWGYKYLPTFSNLSDPLTDFNEFYEIYYLNELAYRIQNYYQIPHTPFVLEQRAEIKEELRKLKEVRTDVQISATSQANTQQGSVLALSLGRGYEK